VQNPVSTPTPAVDSGLLGDTLDPGVWSGRPPGACCAASVWHFETRQAVKEGLLQAHPIGFGTLGQEEEVKGGRTVRVPG
jgi:hypothetical protein